MTLTSGLTPPSSLLRRIRSTLIRAFRRSRHVWFVILLSLLLSGCMRYDVGVRFDSPNQGTFTQHIRLEERLQQLSGTTAQQWLKLIEQRSQQLGGRIDRLPDNDLLVTIPFTSSGDLQRKFNQFFSPLEKVSPVPASALPPIASRFTLATSNLLLVERNHLRYELDLRSLGVRSSSGSVLLSPASLIDLEFRLQTPWGAKSLTAANLTSPAGALSGKTLVWQLVPGTLNQLEVVFWLPSPLGIGTVAIVLLVLVGRFLKYPRAQTVPENRPAV
ncbi:MAG: DUF3153 domain-containing protein [Lyngbya sp. HA4199-MV5]|jgi:hypothetical protein|nr:DUF3153 domain-containing protein [Lyngbya sp. HA4199-MV5]